MCNTNRDGETARREIQLIVHSPPILEQFSFPSSLQEGGRAQVTCYVTSGDMPIHFAWYKDDVPISASLQVHLQCILYSYIRNACVFLYYCHSNPRWEGCLAGRYWQAKGKYRENSVLSFAMISLAYSFVGNEVDCEWSAFLFWYNQERIRKISEAYCIQTSTAVPRFHISHSNTKVSYWQMVVLQNYCDDIKNWYRRPTLNSFPLSCS